MSGASSCIVCTTRQDHQVHYRYWHIYIRLIFLHLVVHS